MSIKELLNCFIVCLCSKNSYQYLGVKCLLRFSVTRGL